MKTQTPALDHWAEVHEHYRKIEEFLDWLWESHKTELATLNPRSLRHDSYPVDRRKFLDEFFEVDQAALERERRELLSKP